MSTVDDFIQDFVPKKPVFTMAEVAEITGFPQSSLAEDCRKKRIEHQFRGRIRVLTYPQLVKLIRDSHQATDTPTVPVDERFAAARARAARRILAKEQRAA